MFSPILKVGSRNLVRRNWLVRALWDLTNTAICIPFGLSNPMGRRLNAKLAHTSGAQSRANPKGNTFTPEARLHPRWLTIAVCLFLALAVWAVFGQIRHHGFVNYDDDRYVYENPAIAHGLSWNGFVWAFTRTLGDNWHPLTTLSHMLDCQLYGLHPGGHHLTSVLLHAVTAILLFLVLRKMTGAFWRCAFVAAVFAIHPLRVESVAWISERKDVLSGLFFMLTLWAYACCVQKQEVIRNPPVSSFQSPSYWFALLFFSLGLMSKPMLVTLPFVLLLLDCWPLQRLTIGSRLSPLDLRLGSRLVLEKIPFFGLTAAACMATLWAQQGAISSFEKIGLPTRIGNALITYAAYLGQMLYPVRLAVFYPYPINNLLVWKVFLSALVLSAVSVWVMAVRRRHPCLLVGWLWYLGMLVPVIGLVQVGGQARADRYTYLPQIGLGILLAWGMAELCGSWRYRRALLGSAGAVILGGLLAGAYIQTGYWKDSISLWTNTLACTSDNYIAHHVLGDTLAEQGKYGEAAKHYEQALQLRPDYAVVHVNWSKALMEQGKWSEAVQHCERALQLKPVKTDAALARNNLGYILAKQGRLAEAIKNYEQALQLDPDSALASVNMGNALFIQRKWAEAILYYARTLQLNPDDADAHNNMGMAFINMGKPDEALHHFQQALALATAQGKTALAEAIRIRLKSPLPKTQTP